MKKTKDNEICLGHSVGPGELEGLKEKLDGEAGIGLLSKIFKGLGDPSRLRIIYVLSISPLCVCDIATILDMTQSSISHHLRVLRDLNLVKFQRDGKLIIYSLDDEHVMELFRAGLEHTKH